MTRITSVINSTYHTMKFFQTVWQNFHFSSFVIRDSIGKVPAMKKFIPCICENMQLLQRAHATSGLTGCSWRLHDVKFLNSGPTHSETRHWTTNRTRLFTRKCRSDGILINIPIHYDILLTANITTFFFWFISLQMSADQFSPLPSIHYSSLFHFRFKM